MKLKMQPREVTFFNLMPYTTSNLKLKKKKVSAFSSLVPQKKWTSFNKQFNPSQHAYTHGKQANRTRS